MHYYSRLRPDRPFGSGHGIGQQHDHTSSTLVDRSYLAAVSSPVQQCLPLARPAKSIARLTVLSDLSGAPSKRLPAHDLTPIFLEHPIAGDELRAIKKYLAESKSKAPQLFITERGTPISRQNAYDLITKAGELAGLGSAHPHMLRHSCGYHMASEVVDFRTAQDFLGHIDPKHTAQYMKINASRFNSVWGRR